TGGTSGMRAQTTFTDASPAADGEGTMSVSPTQVTRGQAGVTLTFTFSAQQGSFSNNSTVKLVVPSGWPAPTGLVTITSSQCSQPATGTGNIAISGSTITVTQNSGNNKGFVLTYGPITVPTGLALGPSTFTTSTDNSPLSTARPIAAQPVVTVFISSATVVSRTGPNPSMYGDPLTFTATVTPASTPTGSVSFYDGGTCAAPGSTLASAVPLSGGQATYSSSTSSVGPHTILACYSGDATY